MNCAPSSHNNPLPPSLNKSKSLESEYARECESRRIPYDFTVMNAVRPGEGILEAIEQCKPKMIVMGSRGLGPIKRTFIGSVSDYVLHNVNIPCTIVPNSQ